MKKPMRHGIHSYYIKLSLAVVAAICIGAGCSRTTQMSDTKPVGGFLPQPTLMQAGTSGQATLVYLNPQMKGSNYNKVILDPVTIWTDGSSRLLSVPPEQRQAMAENFQDHIYKAISKECVMVTEPAADTVRIRVALVDADQSDPVLNTIATYIPQAHVVSTLTAFAFNDGAGVFAGSATAEGFATDSKTGELLWEGVDKRAGQNALLTNTFNSWGDVDNAFAAWAEQFKTRLKALGICPH